MNNNPSGKSRLKPLSVNVCVLLFLAACPGLRAEAQPPPQPAVTVAAYYFPNYHPGEPRNDLWKGKGWDEWKLVREATPRFAGEHQPNVPLWGYGDESDPRVMEQKIAAAADHGIGAFIFDWYYYNDGPYLGRCLDLGYLKASNNARVKFALMWANHDWADLHPAELGQPHPILFPGTVTPENFGKICDLVIRDYFLQPTYWRIDGKPYFSFYDLAHLLANFGSAEATRAALDEFRRKAVAAGLPGLHLNAVVLGRPALPNEQVPRDAPQRIRDLGFDSVTSYVWVHHVKLATQPTDYAVARDEYLAYWDQARTTYGVPFFPNVTVGWDTTPRCAPGSHATNGAYPFSPTISGNTPARFREALESARQRLLAQPSGPRVLTVNSWNEWTEGSYLEPDTVNGLRYLEAIRDVFGTDGAMSSAAGLSSH